MQTPAIPASEERRLTTLHSLGLLDSEPEARFDAITRVAARLFDVPIALISLVDANRQWFKSRQGLDATETPRDVSFCGHAINGDDVFLVPDACSDERFADNPLVQGEPRVRFYAGQPLAAPNGEKLGTLCLIDRKARALNGAQTALLKELGAWVEAEIALMTHWNSVGGFLDRLLQQFKEPVLIAREDMTIQFANDAALKLLQFASEEIVGRPLLKIFPERERMKFEVFAAALMRAEDEVASLEYVSVARRKDTREFGVALAFFRTVVAGRGVTAVVLREHVPLPSA